MQSGTANMPWGTNTMEEGKRRSLELAFEILGCPKTKDLSRVNRLSPQHRTTEASGRAVGYTRRYAVSFPSCYRWRFP